MRTVKHSMIVAVMCSAVASGAAGAQTFVPSSTLPADVTNTTTAYPAVTLEQLSTFAWQQFVALNYPADPAQRGTPLATSSLGDAADARVWETYYHRVEVFSANEMKNVTVPGGGGTNYVYTGFSFDAANYGGPATAMPDVSTIWNNLDENNELNVDEMFAHVSSVGGPPDFTGFTDDNRILFEAKMNPVGAEYIFANNFQQDDVRDKAAPFTAASLNLYAGKCNSAAAAQPFIQFPCSLAGSTDGHLEVKAAWKPLTAAEKASGDYYTNTVLRYQNTQAKGSKTIAGNKWYVNTPDTDVTYGLIALHILRKTTNFPTFVIATFEHQDNIASGIGYLDEISQTSRGTDVAGTKVVITDRDNPIPTEVDAVNTTVQAAIAGTVWANYKLIGVQAYPVDYSTIGGASQSDISTYFLANIVVESNSELQNFRGQKSGGAQNDLNIFDPVSAKQINMGGCMGCHGVAQSSGNDMSFLIKNAPFGAPEVVGSNIGIIDFITINTYADVQTMLTQFVTLNSISVDSAPHGEFWEGLSYDSFINGYLPFPNSNYFADNYATVPIVTCGDSKSSNLVQVLEQMNGITIHSSSNAGDDSVPEMPAGGPYFPEEQIDSFAAWVDNNCPQ